MRTNLIFFLVFISSICTFSQESIHKYYNIENGVPSNEVYHAFQDSKGYIWFSTDNGVSRFNGYEFENYGLNEGLPDNTIFYMYEDLKNRIWFISFSCQLSYFYHDSIYQYQHNNVLSDTLLNRTRILTPSFYVDSHESLHFGTNGQGVFEIDKSGFVKNRSTEEFLQIELKNNMALIAYDSRKKTGVKKFSIQYERKKYVADLEWGNDRLYSVNLKKNNFLFSNGQELWNIIDGKIDKKYKFGFIAWLGKDSDSNIWVSEFNNGVYCYSNLDLDSKPSHYLKGKTVTSVFIDINGTTWITSLDGIYSFSSLKISNRSIKTKSNKKVYRVEKGALDEVWFSGNNSNIYQLTRGRVEEYLYESRESINSLNYNHKLEVLTFGGSNIFGVIQNKIRRDYSLSEAFPQKKQLPSFYFKQTVRISDTLSWYVGYHVGQIYHNLNSLSVLSRGSEISKIRPLCIYYDKDSVLYIGTKNGLWQYTNSEFDQVDKNNDLLKKKIVDISKDNKGNLWLAAKGSGVVIVAKDTIIEISEKDGLSSNSVNTLWIEGDVVWAGTMKGLNKITVRDITTGEYKIECIYQYHGLASNIINDVMVNNGILYAGTDGGLSYFNISDFTLNQNMVPVYITDISISEKDTLVQDSYQLAHSQNTISIKYVGLNYRNGSETRYKYRLVGVEEAWVETKQRLVRYPKLSSGEYCFEVLAMNENGIWGDKPASISFIINQPYWETWWFYLLVFLIPVLLVSIVLWSIYRIQIRETKKRSLLHENLNRLRQEALAQQMNPHFIFNTLSSIQYYISENDRKASNKYLTMFSRLMRITLNNSYQKNITIAEEVEALEMYIKLEQLRFDEKFSFNVEIDSSLNPNKYIMPSLLLQPFVENAIWHGIMHKEGSGHIEITITLHQDSILCTIEDDGIGRKKSTQINLNRNKTHKSLGSKITESRLKLINSYYGNDLLINYVDLLDNNGEGRGTKVEISLPIISNKNV